MIVIPFSTRRQVVASPLDELRRWGVDQLDELTRRELMQSDVQRPRFFDISYVNRPADRVAYVPSVLTLSIP
ncbi:MAG: hypothetical protein E6R03_04480 [Hyphomicrobiaceae bacterium]|nr:MAG: hypothetical protein E6R03_04480 [Hyphomicrobiaceae bacterium]